MNEPGRSNRADQGHAANTWKSCWLYWNPANRTDLPRTSTDRAGNTGQLANGQERAASPSSDASSRRFRLPRAWASRATSASGRNCCGSEIEGPQKIGPTANWRARPVSPAQVLLAQPEEKNLQSVRRLWAPARQWALGNASLTPGFRCDGNSAANRCRGGINVNSQSEGSSVRCVLEGSFAAV